MNKITFYGPTYFAPIIKKVIDSINDDLTNRPIENHYYILMILTDGIINDMDKTIDNIVEASKLPLSIIIIGIGKANFSNMEYLDGDKVLLVDSKGNIRKRDIVQFVEFNKFKNKNDSNELKDSSDGKEINKIKANCENELAEEVLKEIPRQLEDYYLYCGRFNE